jgi:hypothetical protein
MKIISSKPKGQRFFKSVKFSDESKRPFLIEPVDFGWCFCLEQGQWVKETTGANTLSYYAMTYDGFNNAYSLKAVKRLIAKWNVPKGTKFRASLPFVGYDFFLTK